ncbi:hypothetical protein P3S68_001659 [Capsicum galapagoense]
MEEGEALFKRNVEKGIIDAKKLLKLIRGGSLDQEKKFKWCLIWIMHYILLARNLSKIVDIDTIKIVDNLSFFERYPWDKKSFASTLDYLKKWIDFTKKNNTYVINGVSSFALYGFSLVFLIWIYEAFLELGRGDDISIEDLLPIL